MLPRVSNTACESAAAGAGVAAGAHPRDTSTCDTRPLRGPITRRPPSAATSTVPKARPNFSTRRATCERHRGRPAGSATLLPLQDLRILGVLDAVLLSNGAHRHEVEGEDLEVQLVQAPRAKVRVVRRHARLAQALRCAGTSTIKARRGGSARERGPRRRGKAGPHLVVVRGPHALAPRDLCVPSEVLDHEAAAHDGRQADGSPQRDNLERKTEERGQTRRQRKRPRRTTSSPRSGIRGLRLHRTGWMAGLRTAWLYQSFMTGTPLGISRQFLTASSQPARIARSPTQHAHTTACANGRRRLSPMTAAMSAPNDWT